jgi:hypothetical protein
VNKMTNLEKIQFPEFKTSKNKYIEVRNKICKLWQTNIKEYLSLEMVLEKDPSNKEFVPKIFTFLLRYGHINFGIDKKYFPELNNIKKKIGI